MRRGTGTSATSCRPGSSPIRCCGTRADRLVLRWCTAAAVLSALPVVLLAVRGLHEPVPPPLLAAHAVHGFVVVLVGGYPFERIRHLATG